MKKSSFRGPAASMTAEASVLIPLLLAVFLSVFCLSGFVFDRAVLRSVTCAEAVTGRQQDTGPLLFLSERNAAITESDGKRTAECRFTVFDTSLFPLPETALRFERNDPDPVSRIRKAREILYGTEL